MISGPRVAMTLNMIKQTPDVESPDPMQFPTGYETEYAKYLFNDRSDVDGRVYTSIARKCIGSLSPVEHTLFIKSVDDEGNESIHIHEVSPRKKHHDIFVSELKLTKEGNNAVRRNGHVSKGMSYNQPQSYMDGEWAVSCSLPTAIMSDSSLIEDSYKIAKSAASKMLCYGTKDYIFNLKPGQTLLNIWGDINNPRYVPRVGDIIGPSGQVIGVSDLSAVDPAIELSDVHLHKPIAFYNNIHHNDGDAEGLNRAVVIDVEVLRNDQKDYSGPNVSFNIPDKVQEELDQHAKKNREYYENIVHTHMRLASEYGGEKRIPYSYKARRLIYEAIAKAPRALNDKIPGIMYRPTVRKKKGIERVYAYDSIETYRIKVTVRYPFPLTVSGKIADFSGTKGIISNIAEDEDMPLDEFGQRVMVMRCCGAQLRRSTYLPIYLIYMSHASRHVVDSLKDKYREEGIEAIWPELIELSRTFNDLWADLIDEIHSTKAQKEELWEEITNRYFRASLPTDNNLTPLEICRLLKGKYKIKKSKLLITRPDGKKEWTAKEFYIGNIPTIRLDKHGREFSSISSPRFDPFGTIAKTTAHEATFRPAPTKTITYISESEDRLMKNHGDEGYVDEIKDRSNNPLVSKIETINILRSPTPMNIDAAVDREKHPLGKARPLQMVQHVHRVGGLEIKKVKK